MRAKWFLKVFCIFILIILTSLLMIVTFQSGYSIAGRSHGQVLTEQFSFTESSKELKNPNRGFYYMYGFVASDEEQDYQKEVEKRIGTIKSMTLAMVQVNLREYSNGSISKEALANIEELFQALERQEKQYLVRFLYDWSGKNSETEPREVDIILNHMRQLENIFRKHKDIIFVHQGIFIGNWGEMNGTQHLEHMQELALQLEAVTDDSTFLAVRMPAQWRKITQLAEPSKDSWEKTSIANRLSLFNDGILGNNGDYGTYGTKSREEVGDFTHWNREEELVFQEELCKAVPNGGEVIIDNSLNDFENAIKDMATMHITYLNRDYDQNVLNKWAETTVVEDNCFNGMDGLSYIERHLGYRLLIKEVDLSYEYWQDVLKVNVTLQNVGFAPIYKKPEIYCVLSKEDGTEIRSFQIQADVRELVGGNEADKLLTVSADISLAGYTKAQYDVYFYMKDPGSGKHILLANEQEEDTWGYRIGQIEIEPLKNPITGKELEVENWLKEWLQSSKRTG